MEEVLKADAARIIVTSSDYYEYGYMNWDDINNDNSQMDLITLYGRSKLANILFANELAERLNGIFY